MFLARLSELVDGLVLLGRLDSSGAKARYPIGARIEFVSLGFYASLARPLRAARAMRGSLRTFWRTLDDVDAVWLLGPHPLAIAFAVLALARGRRVALGVRQNTPAYVRTRHPGRLHLHAAAWVLEAAFKLLAMRVPVVAVGPDVARRYARARRLLEIVVSLVETGDIVTPEQASARSFAGELTALSVGRIDAEKNPLLLAEALAQLGDEEPGWRLKVCGEGALEEELAERLEELGVGARAELLGYVPFGEGLTRLYLESHALLHVSWTEGMPQVLIEAFAAGLPVVATDVGGIRVAVGGAVRLIPPGDPGAAASALQAIAGDSELRHGLIRAGHEFALAHTLTAEASRVAEFLQAP